MMYEAFDDVRRNLIYLLTVTDTGRSVDEVTNRTSGLETNHDDIDRKIKGVLTNLIKQIYTLEKRVRKLENEMTKVNAKRSADPKASSEARAALQARIGGYSSV